MAVTGADAWYIACVILGREFVWRKIERDESVIQMLIEVEKDFWNNNILAKKMPAPDGSEAADKILSEYYGKSDPEKVIPLIGFDEKLKRRAEILELQDKLDQEKKQIEQEVKLVTGLEKAVRDLAVIALNRLGTEGETGRSEGGESYSFDNAPRQIYDVLNRFRLARVGGRTYETKTKQT